MYIHPGVVPWGEEKSIITTTVANGRFEAHQPASNKVWKRLGVLFTV